MSEQTFDIVRVELECHANPRPGNLGASLFSESVVASFVTFEDGKIALMRYPRAAGYALHCPNGDQFIWRDDGRGGINWVKISPEVLLQQSHRPMGTMPDTNMPVGMADGLQWLADMREP